ncbi:response regulator transcription factor [Trinickia acidisoli]|uniref:response regulator transcription factor n=1 Tax=Trinickia acidisoli TaxID=2767482 RepID=UPI001A8F1DB5|nr:response regulator transcription factor [Trinickia acidisoli]
MTFRQVLLLSRPRHRIRIAVLDDHPIVALGVTTYLHDYADFELVANVATIDDLFAVIDQGRCDVAIVDFYLPEDRLDGATFVKRLRVHAPRLGIVVLSAARASDAECICHRAGANAFLEKSTPLSLIAETIRSAVASPRKFFVIREGKIDALVPHPREDTLSAAEVEILRHIAEGLSVTQTAERLRRSKKTVSTHKRSAMRKLRVSDDFGLALFLKEKFR